MPRRPAKLSNCYVPLPLQQPGSTGDNSNKKKEIAEQKQQQFVRPDGRTAGHELRQLCLETCVVSKAMGSSLVELGHTKVLVEVHVAAAASTSKINKNNNNNNNNEATNDVGSLKCNVKYAPHIGIDQVSQRSRSVVPLDGNNSNNNANNGNSAATISAGKLNQELSLQESDLSRQLTAALLPVVILKRYPKCSVVVNTLVLQDDGSCLSAAITAASMALVDARVELRDVVVSCTVAVVTNDDCDDDDDDGDNDRWVYLADPTEREVNNNSNSQMALICLAMTPNHKEVTLWSQSGRLSSEMASHAMELCRDGCRTMHKFMRASWLSSASVLGDGDEEITPRQ
mmetsp:Transcript_26403/g.56684  ORF Transcript_26403/g.56684 Transcript_26403/m.56684 type:complete len:343 (-) Transcript_26403:1591-2619(-)